MSATAKVTTCAPQRGRQTVQVCLTRTGAKPSAPLNSEQAVCNFVRPYANADRESFHVLHLDSRNRVIGHEEAHKGVLTGVEVHPREVFKGAILNNAASVVLAHNHPSGSVDPSQADKELTQRLADAGNLVGIPVRDHVIVGADGCYSFRGAGFAARFGAATGAKHRRSTKVSASEATACPPGCQKTKTGNEAVWWALGLLGVPLGVIGLWKWRQITASGVPLNFALRRVFSNFTEGHRGLVAAWDARSTTP